MKEKVTSLITTFLEENPELFLIELKILENNKIIVHIDGIKEVSIDQCIQMSRCIEHNLDREEEDFSLEVSSVGIDTPLTDHRQYIKNEGRVLEITLQNGEIVQGTLSKVEEDKIVIENKVRENKTIGKGKQTVVKENEIAFNTINKAVVQISF